MSGFQQHNSKVYLFILLVDDPLLHTIFLLPEISENNVFTTECLLLEGKPYIPHQNSRSKGTSLGCRLAREMISIVGNCAVWACKPLRRNLKISYGLRFGTPIRVCYLERGISYQVKQRAGDRASLQKIWKSDSMPISTKIRLMKALVWPVATYGCESYMDSQKEWRNTFWRLWDERTEKDSAGFIDSKENKWVCS